jgi:hypothetical protein
MEGSPQVKSHFGLDVTFWIGEGPCALSLFLLESLRRSRAPMRQLVHCTEETPERLDVRKSVITFLERRDLDSNSVCLMLTASMDPRMVSTSSHGWEGPFRRSNGCTATLRCLRRY